MITKKRILILLPTGMTIRNIISTRIIEHILENSPHEIICSVNNPSKYLTYIEHERVKFIDFHEKKLISFTNLILLILRRRFYSINENKTLNIMKKGPFSSDLTTTLMSYLNYPFPKSIRLFNFFKHALSFFYRPLNEIESQFLQHKPDLVFSTHLVAKHEFDYLMSARKNKVPTIGMVKSFDNLTGKGFLPYETDYTILWNDIMQKEIVDIYKYDERKTVVTGVPQFDIYKEKPEISRQAFLDKYNLSSNKKIILFATNHHTISPDDQKNIDYIASKLKILNAQMIVRLHPTDNLERYNGLNFNNVCFQVPGIGEGQGSHERVAYQEFLADIRDTLYFSDVTINTASTMTLDASALDKPVINIAYDWEHKPYYQSVRRYYDFLHYEPIIKSNGTSLAKSIDDLYHLIDSYLKNPDIKKMERKNLVGSMLAGNKGNAAISVSNAVLEVLNGKNS